MAFSFDERKAVAATALLLDLAKGKMEYIHLIKLLYRADRESIGRYGAPIIGDRYVSMSKGPVLSVLYNRFKDIRDGLRIRGWEAIGRADEFTLVLSGPFDVGPLSEADIKILQEVFRQEGTKECWDAVENSHKFPEWESVPAGTSKPIPVERMLRELHKSEKEIEEIAQRAREKAYFDALFGA